MLQASLLQEEHAQGRTSPTGLEVRAEGPDALKLKDPSTDEIRTVLFSSESDPFHITWQCPQHSVFHVIECSVKFVTVEQEFAHIQTGCHAADGTSRAFKGLAAIAANDAPKFYPGINLRDCRVEQGVFACAPPAALTNTDDGNDVWQYPPHVLDLLRRSSSYRLSRWLPQCYPNTRHTDHCLYGAGLALALDSAARISGRDKERAGRQGLGLGTRVFW